MYNSALTHLICNMNNKKKEKFHLIQRVFFIYLSSRALAAGSSKTIPLPYTSLEQEASWLNMADVFYPPIAKPSLSWKLRGFLFSACDEFKQTLA